MIDLDINNASVIEWAWTVVSLAGLLTTVWLLRDARRDRDALIAAGRNGPGRRLADGLVRGETMRCAKLGLMSVLGLIAMVSPPAPGGQTTARAIVLCGLILVALAITTDALLDRKMRRDVDAEILKVYAAGGTVPVPPKEQP